MAGDRRRNDAISDAMLDELTRSDERSRTLHTLQVTSFGGSGTTALYEHFARAGLHIPATPGQFPFKHQRVPPAAADVPAGFRVVYPYADPRNAVVSLFRRGYQGGHYRGMHLCKPTAAVEEQLTDLDHFLDAGIDLFGLEDHFDRWHEREARDYPVLFVRYEALPAVWPQVRDFVGLGSDDECLPLRTRASEWQALAADARARLDEMYGRFARRLADLAPSELR